MLRKINYSHLVQLIKFEGLILLKQSKIYTFRFNLILNSLIGFNNPLRLIIQWLNKWLTRRAATNESPGPITGVHTTIGIDYPSMTAVIT